MFTIYIDFSFTFELKILKYVLSSLIVVSAAAKQLKAVVASTLLKF